MNLKAFRPYTPPPPRYHPNLVLKKSPEIFHPMQKTTQKLKPGQAVEVPNGTIKPVYTTPVPVVLPKQQIHYMGTSSTSDGGYQGGLEGLVKANKRIICMQLTREHLIVVTEQ